MKNVRTRLCTLDITGFRTLRQREVLRLPSFGAPQKENPRRKNHQIGRERPGFSGFPPPKQLCWRDPSRREGFRAGDFSFGPGWISEPNKPKENHNATD